MGNQPLNLVVIGETGVGKSTFLNYLLDEEVFASSNSVPATPKGFWHHDAIIRGFPVHLIDSWGVEGNKSEEWIRYLNEELKKRGVGAEVSEWFHGVCYLIDAPGSRVQPFDISILSTLQKEGYSVLVILTKAGKATDNTLESLRAEIERHFGKQFPIVAVNSIKEVIRGHVIETFGIDEVEQQLVLRFWETIIQRVPRRIGYLLKADVEELWDRAVVQNDLNRMSSVAFWDANGICEKRNCSGLRVRRWVLRG